MPADEPTEPHEQRLTPEQVGARVSAILAAAEHEAREIIAAAQRQLPAPAAAPAPAPAPAPRTPAPDPTPAADPAPAPAPTADPAPAPAPRTPAPDPTAAADPAPAPAPTADPAPALVPGAAAGALAQVDDLAQAVERLSARFDAFELETAARLEDLWRDLRTMRSVPEDPDPAAPESRTEQPETAAQAAARVRAIDLALAGFSREAIADELAASMDRGEVEQLLSQILLG